MKKPFILHPFLYSIFPVLFLCSHNLGELSIFDVLIFLLIILTVTALFFWVGWIILKDSIKVAILETIFIFVFFSYGHIFDFVQGRQVFYLLIIGQQYLIFGIGVFLIVVSYFIIKTNKKLFLFTRILNISSLSLVLFSLLTIGGYELKKVRIGEQINILDKKLGNTSNQEGQLLSQDIYYIILDSYASSNILKEVYNFDNSDFLNFLVEKGFYIATRSFSNYAFTYLSLASSLNMQYLNYLANELGTNSKDKNVLSRMIRNNTVMKNLKLKGYKFIHFSSGWGPTDRNNNADLEIRSGKWNELARTLFQTTILSPFEKYFNLKLIEGDERGRVLGAFDNLERIYKTKGPKFVFAHLPVPHYPYIFGANGEPVIERKGNKEEILRIGYLNQLIFVNKRIKTIINEILSKSKIPPIIILQADHGPSLTLGNFGWENPNKKMLRERMTIFNAFFLPSRKGIQLPYATISPVNTFRIIFNYYFNLNYELLNDQGYYSTYDNPYKFIDVTEKIKE